jgi:hypothetical protein
MLHELPFLALWRFCSTGVFDRNGKYLDAVHMPCYYIRKHKN